MERNKSSGKGLEDAKKEGKSRGNISSEREKFT